MSKFAADHQRYQVALFYLCFLNGDEKLSFPIDNMAYHGMFVDLQADLLGSFASIYKGADKEGW